MANFYTSSPLGLIDDINIKYNQGSTKLDTLFTAYKSGSTKHFLKRSSKSFRGILSNSPHSNEIYDISTTNIIERLKEIPHLQLRYADFAYLQDYGVYPNNRLIIARRFKNGIRDDIYSAGVNDIGGPLSTIIGYVKESEDFLNFSFSEKWGDADVSFKDVLNDVGKDFRMDRFVQLGDYLDGGAGVIPLPGASELFQRQIMAGLGIITDNGQDVVYRDGRFVNSVTNGEVDVPTIPVGDPNLIKEARQRKLGKAGEPFSGLKGTFTVTFTVRYEQKFINGNDPTIVYADILHNLLNMGTSRSTFYLGKNIDASNDLGRFFQDLYKNPIDKIGKVIEEIYKSITAAKDKLVSMLNGLVNKDATDVKNDVSETIENLTGVVDDIIENVKDFLKNKYRIRLYAIINALTGAPSTPWHITIGNPLRPIFCSGDMICEDVNIKLGSQLSFNDLPTYIEATLKYSSARDLGLQEIFAKLNAGGIRTSEGTTSNDKYDYSVSISEDFWSNGGTDTGINENDVNNITSENFTSGINFINQTGGQSIDSVNTQNTNNTSSTRVPESANTNTDLDVTSIQSSSQVNPDTSSEEPIVDAGQNAGPESIRVDNNQESTGNTEGFASQVEEPTNIANSGLDANNISSDTEAVTNEYTYKVVTVGPKKHVEAYDSSGNIVYSGKPMFSISENILLEEAKRALSGQY